MVAQKDKSKESVFRFQLQNAISSRSAQDEVLWSMFGVFWGANAIMLVALFTTGRFPIPAVGLIISILGFLLSNAWHIMQGRAILHIEKFEQIIEQSEEYLSIPAELKTNRPVAEGISARNVIRLCSLWATLIWLVFLLGFVIQGTLNLLE